MPDIRRIALGLILAASLTTGPPAKADVRTRVARISGPIAGTVIRDLPFAATHVAVYWVGHRDAKVTLAFSRDGRKFGPAIDAGRDEIGAARANGITYGAIRVVSGATSVRVKSNKVIRRLTVLALPDPVSALVSKLLPGKVAHPGATRPEIISRSAWGADESLRFAKDGSEEWPPEFAPVQKLIVHHTDTRNDDPNPAATVRAIYYYHAVTQGWGDIGYNFLIDASGRVYKGRHAHAAGSTDDPIAGEDNAGNGVTAAHALRFNKGTVGIALLGNYTSQGASPAAREALEHLLAWKANKHGVNPNGATPYTNSAGSQTSFPNIAGHRDVAPTTECPGGTFYKQLPAIRNNVAARVAPS